MSARIVRPLTMDLLLGAVAEEQDPLTRELAAATPLFLQQFLTPISVAMIGRGRVLGAAGLMPQWPGRAIAWMSLSAEASRRERARLLIHVRGIMDETQREDRAYQRIEMHVRAAEPWCAVFGRALRFHAEGVMRSFDPYGRDYVMFARVAG